MFSKFCNVLQTIFECEQREENNNITRNSSRSDISALLTLLSATVLLRVPSLTKFEVCNFPLLHFPKWLSLVHGQLAMSLRRIKRCQLLRFYFQFSSTKILKTLQILVSTVFLRNIQMFLIDVDRPT